MNQNWKQYLQTNGAQNTDAASDNKKADTMDIICDLSSFSVLVIAGDDDDATSFIQGQFTNDVAAVNEENSQLSAICNNKGRMIANFRLFKHQQNYFLSLKSDLVEKSISHLQNYILRAHVAIQDVSEQLIHIGISGDHATDLLSPFIENINPEIDSISFNDNYIVIRVASLHSNKRPRYEIFCSIEHATVLWQKVSEQAEVVNSSTWDYLNIQAGIPFIDANSSEEFVPQMANMELINGISFTKGCFTGQEIVARMHYLGKLKKRCYKIHIASDDRPNNGDKLFAENARAGQNTGSIIQAENNPESGYDALAVIQIADTETNLFLHDADGPKVTIEELPYSLEPKQE